MHIPSSMLNGSICPVTATVAAAGVGLAGYYAAKSEEKPSTGKFAAVTSLVFAMQMLNFPVQSGTSGHLIGGVLAAGLLGVPFAVLAMTLVLTVQTFFFADGGVNALGANIVNMSLLTAGIGGLFLHFMMGRGINKKVSLGVASLTSVLLAAVACSFQVAAAGTVDLTKALPAMLSVHALIGIGEALLTVALYSSLVSLASFWKEREKSLVFGALGLSFLGALFSPLASGSPDGLEWVAGKLAFHEFSAFEFPTLFSNYQLLTHPLSTALAGMIGIATIFLFSYGTSVLSKR